jgi:hypothetical protein
LRARLCIANFRSRLRGEDRFDDWVMGRQFVPDYLHHPVVGLRLRSAFLHLLRRNGGFSHALRVSGSVSSRQQGRGCAPVSASQISVPRSSGDRFDDWVVGPQFEPNCLHHPVFGFKPSQAISQFVRGNRGFLASGASLNLSLLGDEPAFAGLSLRRKFPFPAQAGDRFDDWVVGPQF